MILILAFAVLFYHWYGVLHESEHNKGLLIALLVSHVTILIALTIPIMFLYIHI